MSLRSEVQKLLQDSDVLAYRPPETYDAVTATYTLFTIVGGPVQLKLLVGTRTGAAVAATVLDITASGVAVAAANPILGATPLNGVIWIPLNVAGTALGAAAIPATVATLTYMLAGVGIIELTVTGVAGSMVLEWAVVYKRLNPASEINI